MVKCEMRLYKLNLPNYEHFLQKVEFRHILSYQKNQFDKHHW